MFNTLTNEWTSGPAMKDKRDSHACFYDAETNSVFVVGGGGVSGIVKTTARLNLNTNVWESTPDLPAFLQFSVGVASKSKDFIGFVAGGETANYEITAKVWGLRRRDLVWEEMPQQLQKARIFHSMVNLASNEIPGCSDSPF